MNVTFALGKKALRQKLTKESVNIYIPTWWLETVYLLIR